MSNGASPTGRFGPIKIELHNIPISDPAAKRIVAAFRKQFPSVVLHADYSTLESRILAASDEIKNYHEAKSRLEELAKRQEEFVDALGKLREAVTPREVYAARRDQDRMGKKLLTAAAAFPVRDVLAALRKPNLYDIDNTEEE